MLILDSHLDLAWNALQWNRDLLSSVHTIRLREANHPDPLYGQGTVALPDMHRGSVAVCLATLLARSTGTPVAHVDYPSPLQAYGAAQGQLAYYRALERAGYVRFITQSDGLAHHVAEWQAWDGTADPDLNRAPPLGFVISMESADPILDPERLEVWWEDGVRVIGPAHYGPGRYAGGTGTELGLTELGLRLLAEMERLSIVLDLTHFTDPAFWQALDITDCPVLASHNNCRGLVPHQRQFSDEQLQAIFERDGVVGVACDVWMLDPSWVRGESTNERVTLNTVVDHIDYICQLSGTSRHAGIGSDLDGGFGQRQSPRDLDTIADLQQLPRLLAGRGYADADISAIMHGNFLRLLGQALGAGGGVSNR